MSAPAQDGPHYLLGHSERELRRLDLQDELYRDVTRRALQEAGVGAGMRVLDLGCGTGSVSRTAAALVGPSGAVVGLDRSPESVAFAAGRAAEEGMSWVDFVVGDLTERRDPEGFDAVVGRFVLMHQPDPAVALRAACASLRPGGLVVMLESYIEILARGGHSVPHSPTYDALVRWKTAVVGGATADVAAGPRLRRTFLDAGLPEPTTRLEARLEGGADSVYYRYLAESAYSMLPEARRLGLDGFDEESLAGLEDRLRDEVVGSGGVLVVWPIVMAWSRSDAGAAVPLERP